MVAGRRKKKETSWSDAYCTPLWLANKLPLVDVDPCSNDLSLIHTLWRYGLDKLLDGLRLPWRGKAFVNWPYSTPMPWALKAIEEMMLGHCTDLIVLCKLDPSTEWWSVITTEVLGPIDRWDFNDRVQFDEPPEAILERKRKREEAIARGDEKIPPLKVSNNFASVILHHRRPDAPMLNLWDVATLWRRVPQQGLMGLSSLANWRAASA